MDLLKDIAQSAQHFVGRVTTKSALNVSLWLVGITLVTVLPAAFFFSGIIQNALIALVFIVVLSALFKDWFFTITNPKYLQSEDWQIEDKRLDQLLLQPGRPGLLPEQAVLEHNPALATQEDENAE